MRYWVNKLDTTPAKNRCLYYITDDEYTGGNDYKIYVTEKRLINLNNGTRTSLDAHFVEVSYADFMLELL